MARLCSTMHPRLTDEAVSKLQSRRIYTVFDLMLVELDKLTSITGLSYKDLLSLRESIVRSFGGESIKGSDLLDAMRNTAIPTGIESLDRLLEGGLFSGEIYEMCGFSSAGKTQLCHTIATNVAQKSNGTVNYIDTKGDFCATRVQLILETRKCDDEEMGRVLERIRVTRVRSTHELLSYLHHLKRTSEKRSDDRLPTKVVIIDSLPAIFFRSSAESNNEYFCALNHLSNVTRYCANKFNVAFVTVNLISRWRETEGFPSVGDQAVIKPVVKPSLGKYWRHVPNTRLLVEKSGKESRRISVWKSNRLKLDTDCCVRITNGGAMI